MSDAIDQFSDEAIERYARQLVLPEIGVEGQLALGAAEAVIIGCGGLGANAALALAQAGLGRLRLYDPDRVELSNLHRQPYRVQQVGQPKAQALAELCRKRNPDVAVDVHIETFNGQSKTALWLDCSDSDTSRRAIDAARGPHTELIHGAVIGMDAQVTVIPPGTAGFTTLFPTLPQANGRQRCADQGVLGPLANMVAHLMAAEALKLAQGQRSPLAERILLIDARDWRFFSLQKPLQQG